MKKSKMILFLLLSLLSLNLFARQAKDVNIDSITIQEQNERLKLFDGYPNYYLNKMEYLNSGMYYDKYSFTLNIYQLNEKGYQAYDAYYYKASPTLGVNKTPLVMIFSGMGGAVFFEHQMAKIFAYYGISSFVVASPDRFFQFLEEPLELFDKTFIDVKLWGDAYVDFAKDLDEIDSKRIGSIGLSLGSLRTLMLYATNFNVAPFVFVVGGVDFAEILAYGEFLPINYFRWQFFKRFHYQNEIEFMEDFRRKVKLDSHYFFDSNKRKPEDVFQFIGETDKIVQSHTQLKLWECLGKPAFKSYRLGHWGTGTMYYLNTLMLKDFFYSYWKKHSKNN